VYARRRHLCVLFLFSILVLDNDPSSRRLRPFRYKRCKYILPFNMYRFALKSIFRAFTTRAHCITTQRVIDRTVLLHRTLTCPRSRVFETERTNEIDIPQRSSRLSSFFDYPRAPVPRRFRVRT
jgi:hypothetical protein